ncbi:MAG: hypothetical protein KatS3mg026_0797 [Bacteroidia bacterium]|nr:MAG: hypothetical protein KatS3mg026_0797 [Bacteroidia bacterium]
MRLADYLALLSEEEKGYLLMMGRTELSPASFALLSALLTGQSVSASSTADRVRLHRLRSWVWRVLYKRSFTPTARPSQELLAWLIKDLARRQYPLTPGFLKRLYAELEHPYARIGLTYALMVAGIAHGMPYLSEQYLRRRLLRETRELYLLIRYQELQMDLNEEMRKAGRTPCTHEAQAQLAAIEARLRKLPQNLGQSRYITPFTWGLVQMLKGELAAAEAAFSAVLALPKPLLPPEIPCQAFLNRWLIGLYQQKPYADLEHIVEALLEQPLCLKTYPANLAIALHHLLRLLWLYGNETQLQTLLPSLTRKVQQLGPTPFAAEVNLALAALYAGLGHRDTHRYLQPALESTAALGTQLEAHLISLLWEADTGDMDSFERAFRKAYRFLHKHRASLLSGPFLSDVLRKWPAPLSPALPFSELAHQWEKHLRQHPTEALLWQITPLPTWIHTRLTGSTLPLHLRSRPAQPTLLSLTRRFLSRF